MKCKSPTSSRKKSTGSKNLKRTKASADDDRTPASKRPKTGRHEDTLERPLNIPTTAEPTASSMGQQIGVETPLGLTDARMTGKAAMATSSAGRAVVEEMTKKLDADADKLLDEVVPRRIVQLDALTTSELFNRKLPFWRKKVIILNDIIVNIPIVIFCTITLRPPHLNSSHGARLL